MGGIFGPFGKVEESEKDFFRRKELEKLKEDEQVRKIAKEVLRIIKEEMECYK
jgi:hypothetical protein